MKDYLKAFDKVIGYDDEKRKLMPICDMMRNPDKYAKLGVVMPSGAILQGDPGYGKTLMCDCFIEACGVPYYVCRKDKADGDFVNYMKKCFDDAAENAPAIVFLDDMDKFANEDKDHKNAEEYVAVQACIDNVKGKNVFVIATTNDKDNLPESLLRAGRFDINLEIEGLDKEDQVKLIAHFLSNKSFVEDMSPEDVWCIVGGGISCAELEKIINDAALRAAYEDRETVSREDIICACLNQRFGGVDSSKQKSEYKRNIVAYHEAGHAIVHELLEPNSVSLISIKEYRAPSGGVTCFFENESDAFTFDALQNKAIGLLAGKAASEIVFGTIDVGTEGDIRKARHIIEDLRDGNVAYGFEYRVDWSVSEATRAKADDILSSTLATLYDKAKTIIQSHRDFLDAVANALLEKETIFSSDIQAIKKELKLA